MATAAKHGFGATLGINFLGSIFEFNAAAWAKTQCTSSTDTIVAPDGVTNAERVTPSGGATDAYIIQTAAILPSVLQSTPFTGSVWMKAATGTPVVQLGMHDGVGYVGSANKTLSGSWVRYSVDATFNVAATSAKLQVGGSSTWPVADGAIDMWGAFLGRNVMEIFSIGFSQSLATADATNMSSPDTFREKVATILAAEQIRVEGRFIGNSLEDELLVQMNNRTERYFTISLPLTVTQYVIAKGCVTGVSVSTKVDDLVVWAVDISLTGKPIIV